MYYTSGGRTCYTLFEVEHVLHFWRSNMFNTSEVEHVLDFWRSNMFYISGGQTCFFCKNSLLFVPLLFKIHITHFVMFCV